MTFTTTSQKAAIPYITVRRILLTELLENQKVECLESENIKSIGDIIDLAGYAPTYSRIIRAVSQLPSNMRTLCEMALDKLTERGFNLKLILKILTEQKSIDDTVIDAINSLATATSVEEKKQAERLIGCVLS